MKENKYIHSPYQVTYHRINDSIFTGIKYAEIKFDDSWVYNDPIKRMYGLTWLGLNKKVGRWMKQHQFDIPFEGLSH